MESYIKKSDVAAEIERRIKEISKECEESKTIQFTLIGKINALENLLPFLNTIKVKEVDLDDDVDNILEANDWNYDKIDFYDFARHFFNLGLNFKTKDIQDALRMEYEKGRADVIAKTLEWINVFNDNNYIMQYSDSCEHPINEIIEWYNNYINRE